MSNNYWVKDGTIYIAPKIIEETKKIVNEIHDILKLILQDHPTNNDLKRLLDQNYFINYYENSPNNYNKKYKSFIYYGLRKFGLFTNFYMNNGLAVNPFNKATDDYINLYNLQNTVINRGLDLLIHVAALDIAHKYIIEQTAVDLNLTKETPFNQIIHDILDQDKSTFIVYKDIYNLIQQAFLNNKITIDNQLYKLNPTGFAELIQYIYNGDFDVETIYFIREGSKLFITDSNGLKKEINDIYLFVDINLIPENTKIPSPYFYLKYILHKTYFYALELVLRYLNNNQTLYSIILLNQTFNFKIQELLYLLTILLYKNIYRTLYNSDLIFKKDNNFVDIVDYYNNLRNIFFSINNDNNETYIHAFDIGGLIQIIVNNSSDDLLYLYNNATIDDYTTLYIYLTQIVSQSIMENIPIQYISNYNRFTIYSLASYLVDLPYRLLSNIIIQYIELDGRDNQINTKDNVNKLSFIDKYYDRMSNKNHACLKPNYKVSAILNLNNGSTYAASICNTIGQNINFINDTCYQIPFIQACNCKVNYFTQIPDNLCNTDNIKICNNKSSNRFQYLKCNYIINYYTQLPDNLCNTSDISICNNKSNNRFQHLRCNYIIDYYTRLPYDLCNTNNVNIYNNNSNNRFHYLNNYTVNYYTRLPNNICNTNNINICNTTANNKFYYLVQ